MSAPVDPSKRFTFIDKRELASVVGSAIAPVDTENPLDAVAMPTTETTLRELYRKGLHIDAVLECAPNTAVLEPLRRPETSEGGIVEVVDEEKGTSGPNCIVYRVVMVGKDRLTSDIEPASFLPIEVGDVIILRNGMLEPLHPKLEPLVIHRMHILAKVNLRS